MIDFNAKLGHFPYRPVEGIEALLRAMDRYGVERAVVSSLNAVFYLNPHEGNIELASAIATHCDRFIHAAVLRPDFTGWHDDLRRCAGDCGARCVVLYPQYHRYDLLSEATGELVELARELGVLVCVQCWLEDPRRQFNREIIQPVAPAVMKAFVEAHPRTDIIAFGLRFGEPEMLGEPLPRNFYFDISNYENMRDLELAMERFPKERLLFGTNFPLYNYVANVEKLARGNIDAGQREAIASGNAKRLLGIH
ncbi:MAG TPA: amidohydrolase family protein [Candidatus Hydrogenedentes bacterium]|nr:amidohydrolase family protein [Candidatus Hydrogenedentota bacterium]HQE82561.1 amidohydrolase family protein [Candidatus Hydrogenedentota bacterium]HQM49367.1 amidohydrolase family protein [Candidatus Hydrogenedentota bacterium]